MKIDVAAIKKSLGANWEKVALCVSILLAVFLFSLTVLFASPDQNLAMVGEKCDRIQNALAANDKELNPKVDYPVEFRKSWTDRVQPESAAPYLDWTPFMIAPINFVKKSDDNRAIEVKLIPILARPVIADIKYSLEKGVTLQWKMDDSQKPPENHAWAPPSSYIVERQEGEKGEFVVVQKEWKETTYTDVEDKKSLTPYSYRVTAENPSIDKKLSLASKVESVKTTSSFKILIRSGAQQATDDKGIVRSKNTIYVEKFEGGKWHSSLFENIYEGDDLKRDAPMKCRSCSPHHEMNFSSAMKILKYEEWKGVRKVRKCDKTFTGNIPSCKESIDEIPFTNWRMIYLDEEGKESIAWMGDNAPTEIDNRCMKHRPAKAETDKPKPVEPPKTPPKPVSAPKPPDIKAPKATPKTPDQPKAPPNKAPEKK